MGFQTEMLATIREKYYVDNVVRWTEKLKKLGNEKVIANVNRNDSFIIGASIESIHSYSLIHDDLPSMDDDDYRRGKLSTHKKFNEATAILAGDALHDLAFTLLSGNLKNNNYKSKLELINYLSLCIGHKGLALGQSLDLEFENKKVNKRQ